MTTPDERTRALRQAGELLQELQGRQDLPQDIRARLKGVLRHYPEEWQLRLMAEEWQRLGDSAFGLAPEPSRPDPLLALKLTPR
jgi:hypothetical protein